MYFFGLKTFDNIPILVILILSVPIISALVGFRDYKITTDDRGLVLFNIFKKPIIISWSEIIRIEVKKSNRGGFYGMETILSFYTENSRFKFNICILDNKIQFFEELMKNCIIRNIEVVDLTGDATKFFTQIKLRLFNFICKFITPLKKGQ